MLEQQQIDFYVENRYLAVPDVLTTDETLCALTEELFDRFVPRLPPLEPVPSDLTTLEIIKLCAARYVSENIGFEGFRATVKQSGNSDSSARRAERQLRDLMNARKDVD